MPRIKIDLPESFDFSTDLSVRITDINYGQHMGNDRLLSLLHEARVQCLQVHQFTELNAGGPGIIMVDTAIVLKKEVFYGATLRIEVAVTDFNKLGCDFVYRITDTASDQEAARAKTGIVFFDYAKKKTTGVPERFRQAFPS